MLAPDVLENLRAMAAALEAEFGPINEVRQENSVGPVVSQELIYQTFLLVLIAAVAIMIWYMGPYIPFLEPALNRVILIVIVIECLSSAETARLRISHSVRLRPAYTARVRNRHRAPARAHTIRRRDPSCGEP